MYGNLKVFAGQEAFDEYAHHLRVFGEPILPDERAALGRPRAAARLAGGPRGRGVQAVGAGARRPHDAVPGEEGGRRRRSPRATMRWGGMALLLFVVFHLLHLTTHTINPGGDPDSPYQRMVNGFSPENWWVPVVYLLAMAALAMHLRHGVWSAAQTLGLTDSPARRRARWNVAGYVTGDRHRRRLRARPPVRPVRHRRLTAGTAMTETTDMPDTTTGDPSAGHASSTTPRATTSRATPIQDTKAPGGPIGERWGNPPVRGADRQPREPPQAEHHHGRHRARRRLRRRDARARRATP